MDEFLEFFEEALKKVKIDYLAIASWGHDVFRNKVRAKGPHQGELVNKVVYDCLKGRVAVIASGGINSKEKALEALENADLVGLSTPPLLMVLFFLFYKAVRNSVSVMEMGLSIWHSLHMK